MYEVGDQNRTNLTMSVQEMEKHVARLHNGTKISEDIDRKNLGLFKK